MRYRFMFVKIDDEWMDEDDAIQEYGMSYVDMVEDSFEVEVEAENWRDAEEKIVLAGRILKEGSVDARYGYPPEEGRS